MSNTTFAKPRGGFAAMLIGLLVIGALLNWTLALIFGRPVFYCALAGSAFAREAMGFYHVGLLLLAPLAVIGVLRGKGEALGLVVFLLVFALLPSFIDTLFNIPPGCGAAR